MAGLLSVVRGGGGDGNSLKVPLCVVGVQEVMRLKEREQRIP